jgi:hypothetical protein
VIVTIQKRSEIVRKIKVLGICLAAVFGVCAVASASAMAENLPEYKACVIAKKNPMTKKYEGEYDGKLCTATPTKTEEESAAKTGKKYDRIAVAPGTTFAATGTAVTITADGTAVKCKHGNGKGEILNEFEAVEKLTFTECTAKVGKVTEPCGKAGTIETNPVENNLYFINAEETEPGVAFSSEGGGVVMEFNCGAKAISIEGFVVGTVINGAKGQIIAFAVNAKKEQARKTVWLFGSETGGLSWLSGEHEATLVMKDTQGPVGVGVYTP